MTQPPELSPQQAAWFAEIRKEMKGKAPYEPKGGWEPDPAHPGETHLEFIDRHLREPKPGGPNGEAEPFETVRASSFHGKPRPVREWLDGRSLFRIGFISILTGPGAVGKTLIALQASVSCTAELPWLAAPIKKGPVIFYSAEEPLEEMHIRCDEICEAENIQLDRLDDFHLIDLNNEINAALITESDEKGKIVVLTELFHKLERTIAILKPVCVWLDNRSLLITGNENDRNLAAFSMRNLQLLAKKHHCAIVLLAHPSNEGMNNGTGASGSTAWFNMARSVVYMVKPKPEKDADPIDPDVRTLTNNKPNYSKPDKQVNVKWEFHRFVCTDPEIKADTDIGTADKGERVYLKCHRWHRERGIKLTEASSPKEFNKMPKAMREGLNTTHFERAQLSLLDNQKIRVTQGYKNGRRVELIEET